MIDPNILADELMTAAAARQVVSVPPSARDASFDMTAAYAVCDELTRRRVAAGRRTVGIKVGYANKAVWRALKLDTLVWAPMYDDTVRYAGSDDEPLSLSRMVSPKIEPEIVVKLRGALSGADSDPSAVLQQIEWIALGFEIIDCPYLDWKFQPVDFVAAFGLHAALVVGPPRMVESADIAALAEELARFKVRLFKDDELVAEGSGRNSLRSPALCVAELASAMSKRAVTTPLAAGDLISTGTLTESQLIAPGEAWRAEVEGIALSGVGSRFL